MEQKTKAEEMMACLVNNESKQHGYFQYQHLLATFSWLSRFYDSDFFIVVSADILGWKAFCVCV